MNALLECSLADLAPSPFARVVIGLMLVLAGAGSVWAIVRVVRALWERATAMTPGRTFWLALGGLVVVAVILRGRFALTTPIDIDETAWLRGGPLLQLESTEIFVNPPTILTAVLNGLGFGVMEMRWVSVLAGGLLTALSGLWLLTVTNRTSALLGAGLFALHPMAVGHGLATRPYAGAIVMVLLALVAVVDTLRDRTDESRWRAALLVAWLPWVNYVAAVTAVPALLAVLASDVRRDEMKRWMKPAAVALALALAVLPMMLAGRCSRANSRDRTEEDFLGPRLSQVLSGGHLMGSTFRGPEAPWGEGGNSSWMEALGVGLALAALERTRRRGIDATCAVLLLGAAGLIVPIRIERSGVYVRDDHFYVALLGLSLSLCAGVAGLRDTRARGGLAAAIALLALTFFVPRIQELNAIAGQTEQPEERPSCERLVLHASRTDIAKSRELLASVSKERRAALWAALDTYWGCSVIHIQQAPICDAMSDPRHCFRELAFFQAAKRAGADRSYRFTSQDYGDCMKRFDSAAVCDGWREAIRLGNEAFCEGHPVPGLCRARVRGDAALCPADEADCARLVARVRLVDERGFTGLLKHGTETEKVMALALRNGVAACAPLLEGVKARCRELFPE